MTQFLVYVVEDSIDDFFSSSMMNRFPEQGFLHCSSFIGLPDLCQSWTPNIYNCLTLYVAAAILEHHHIQNFIALRKLLSIAVLAFSYFLPSFLDVTHKDDSKPFFDPLRPLYLA